MIKRVVLVHGWDGTPEDGWFPWLKQGLEKAQIEVLAPQLPETQNPRIYNWIPALDKAVGIVNEQTFFIGHSMGCQAIVRYLEELPSNTNVGGAIFVAGFFDALTNLNEPQETIDTVNHWLNPRIDFTKVRSKLPKSIAIFSDNDPYVPLMNQDKFQDQLNSEIVIVKQAGHFSGNLDNCRSLPIVFEKLTTLLY